MRLPPPTSCHAPTKTRPHNSRQAARLADHERKDVHGRARSTSASAALTRTVRRFDEGPGQALQTGSKPSQVHGVPSSGLLHTGLSVPPFAVADESLS